MSSIKYVIRYNDFAYNDEWYQTGWSNEGDIKAIYTDKAEAEQVYKKLVVDALYENEMYNYDVGNGDLSQEQYQALDAFVLEKAGTAFDNHGEIPKLNVDDAFEFAKLSELLHYVLVEVDESKPNYVIWLNQEQDYFRNYDSGAISFSQTEDFIEHDTYEWYFLDQISTTLKGSLNTLSESPEILENFLKDVQGIVYSVNDQTLKINASHSDYKTLKALNALLKQPLFEIRQVTLERLAKLE